MKSKKLKLIETVLLQAVSDITNGKTSTDCDESLSFALESVATIINYRYLSPRKWLVPASNDWYINVLPAYDDQRFKYTLRVSRSQFKQLLEIMTKSPVFSAQYRKWSVDIQLAIALYRFGHDGSGASFLNVGHLFGVSEFGVIRQSTDRVIEVLLGLQNSVITWPDPTERVSIAHEMESVLPGCIGYLDGSHFPLYKAPTEDHEAYYSRKQEYSIHAQAICDNNLIFRDVTIGYPASAHDARVFANSPIGTDPQSFLDDGQWLAADSAYKLTRFVITPFRQNSCVGSAEQRRSFNRHFSSQRVRIEQAFGVLKQTFGSLRSIRISVNKANGHRRACEWIMACIILYNLIRPSCDDAVSVSDEQEENEDGTLRTGSEAESERNSLFDWFLNKYIS